MGRARLADLGISVGSLPRGPHNAITDVAGVLVGHTTVIYDEPSVARTGITVIVPRHGAIGLDYAFAGFHRFNGCGEMTGIQWLEETGLLSSAIALTNTHQVGSVRDWLAEYSFSRKHPGPFFLPLAAETYDGWLSDMNSLHLKRDHLFQAMDTAHAGPVQEGCVGGGTGMICYDFKGGIGTSSRIITFPFEQYTVGALVQANHGDRQQLHVNGVPVGLEINPEKVPTPWQAPPQFSSIIVIVATDAPLLPVQCKRLAQRATIGLARTGGVGYNFSGDLFLAFATGHHIPAQAREPFSLGPMIPNPMINRFFDGVAEAVEEAILNALTAAETTTGYQGHTAYALPIDELQRIMAKHRSRIVS